MEKDKVNEQDLSPVEELAASHHNHLPPLGRYVLSDVRVKEAAAWSDDGQLSVPGDAHDGVIAQLLVCR